jgi:hypothetical protein
MRDGPASSRAVSSLGRNSQPTPYVSAGMPSRRRGNLRNSGHPMAPEATKAGSAGAPASTRAPITISTAKTIKNANAGLSSTAAARMDNCADGGGFS